MKFGHIELFVLKPMDSLSFYRDVLGFEVVSIQQGQFVWVRSGALEILLRPGKEKDRFDVYGDSRATMVLYTDNVEMIRKQLVATRVNNMGFDGTPDCLTFTDPDGNWIQVVNPDDH